MELAQIYRKLEGDDFKVLRVLDSLLNKYEYVPLEIIERKTRLNPKRLSVVLSRLNKLKAIIKGRTGTTGYKLTYIGLDLLALNDLSRKDVIAYIGTKVGVGKESEIFLAKRPSGDLVAVKFYKIGRVSFQKVKRVRSYLVDQANWMIRSKVAAEREYKALKDLSNFTPWVPKVYGWSKHAVVLDYIHGIELYRYKVAIAPLNMLRKILHVLRVAYMELGIVHGDLSEYNIIVNIRDNEENPYIIDWPQYVYREDPAHEQLLKRDIEYVIKFFKRRYRVSIDLEAALSYVKGVTNALG